MTRFKDFWKELNAAVPQNTPSIALEEMDGMIGDVELRMMNTSNFNQWWALHQQKQNLLLERQRYAA